MKIFNLKLIIAIFIGIYTPHAKADETYTAGEKSGLSFDDAKDFISNYCIDCHDQDSKKGDLSLEDIASLSESNAAVWKSIWGQLALGQMPPKKKDQPEVVERLLLQDWIVEELVETMKDKGGFTSHLHPKKGNYLDHDLLFGELPGNIKIAPTSTPARLWRVSREEHFTRINELVRFEPKFNPSRPGLMTHGDAVPTDSGGALKIDLGMSGVKSKQVSKNNIQTLRAILSPNSKYGLRNYPFFQGVDSSESLQILAMADKVLNYMAFGLHQEEKGNKSLADNKRSYRPLTPVYHFMQGDKLDSLKLKQAVDFLFESLTFRPPTPEESKHYQTIVNSCMEKVGKEKGGVLGLSAIFLQRDALFRPELTEPNQSPDPHGRIMLQDWELGLAVNHALRYLKPDKELRQAIISGRMRSPSDVKREVERMLKDKATRKPRVLQFFRDYFGHDTAGLICKDDNTLKKAGVTVHWKKRYYWSMFDTTANTDRLIEYYLERDEEVFKNLLTTQKAVVSSERSHFGRLRTNKEIETVLKEKTEAYAKSKKRIAALRSKNKVKIDELLKQLKSNPKDRALQSLSENLKKEDVELRNQLRQAKHLTNRENLRVAIPKLPGQKIHVRANRKNLTTDHSPYLSDRGVLATTPENQRLGILTHPAWLVSQTDANGNHAIHRGIWIRERLLGGGIPDLPITVDAMLPDEPTLTLRERMNVTTEKYCWSCHKKMDPLGLPFEMYNHVGMFRTHELKKPVDTSGKIIDSGVPGLDGDVSNAIDMIQKIFDSGRAEQVFVRYAFRFWIGRNETLNDRPVLQDAYNAYKENGGSMNALITSLLTSDAFLYRTP